MIDKTPVEVLDCDAAYVESLTERFWSKVDRGNSDECWEWTAGRNPQGYGKVSVNGEDRRANRVSYALEEEDPCENRVLHTCDNPPCVNPNHLYLGNQSDNLSDAYEHGKFGAGEDHVHSKLTNEDVLAIRERAHSDETYTSIAEDYDVARSTIGRVAQEERYTEVSE